MSITRLQQARQMYAMGQRVAKTLDGSRPGYRGSSYGSPGRSSSSGPAGGASSGGNYGGNRNASQSYGGSGSTGRERGADRNRTTSTRTTSTPKGPTNIHGAGDGTAPYTYIGGKKYDVTPTTRAERDRATLKQQILNQTKLGGNRIDKFGNTKKSPFRQGGGLGSLLMGALGMFMGIPGLGLVTGGLRNLGSGFKDFERKMRGINPDGTTRTQAEYEQARFDRQQQKRVAKLLEAKNRGYNQIGFGDFTKKTVDFTEGQQAKLDALIAAGYGPTTLNAVNPTFQNDLGNPNMMNLNDVQSIVAASQMPQGMDLAGARRAMTQPGFTDQATVYDPYGIRVDDGRFSYDMNKTSVDDFNNQGILGIDVGYPSNDLMADVSANDLNRIGKYNPNQNIDDIRMFEPSLNPTLTDTEIKGILDGTITSPTGKFA